MSGIYEEPELYQLACAYRDVPAEAGALLAWRDKHAKIARRGADRFSSWRRARPSTPASSPAAACARPRSTSPPAMCAYAAAQAKAAGVDLDVVEADMRDFRIAEADGEPARFDLAITMLNSVCHLFTLDDLVAT